MKVFSIIQPSIANKNRRKSALETPLRPYLLRSKNLRLQRRFRHCVGCAIDLLDQTLKNCTRS